MAPRSPLARLDDMLQAIIGIESMVATLDLSAFASSFMARKATERCIEIVSEASRHIPRELIAEFSIGNRIRHEYDRVDDLIIWKTGSTSIPLLKPIIEAMIAKLEAESGSN